MRVKCLKYDLLGDDGIFISTKTVGSGEDKVRYFTRAGLLWSDINKRCGNLSGKNPRYSDVVNDFADFQDFADWANSQFGYLNTEESGRMWALDKDILLHGNKNYCAELCLFVPMRVNGLFLSNASARGELPIGVSMDRNSIKASCRDYIDGKTKNRHLGAFACPEEAHRAWQKYKISVIRNTAKDFIFHKKLYYALLNRAELIEKDYNNYVVTDWR